MQYSKVTLAATRLGCIDTGVDMFELEYTWIREFLVGRSQRVRVGGQLSDEVRVTSGVPQGSVLGPLFS